MADSPETEHKENFLKKIVKRLSWEDWVLILIIITVMVVQISIFSQFKHIPGPIYGGDLYRERGYAEHIMRGNGFWTDPLFLGEYNYFPWLGHLAVAWLAKISSLSIEQVSIYFPAILLILISIGLYLLGKKVFNSKVLALLLVLFNIALAPIESKSTAGLAKVCAIFFIYFWLKYEENNLLRYSILAGSFLGLIALSHGSVFINAIVFLGCVMFFEFLWKLKKSEFKISQYIKEYAPMLATAFLVSLLFYGPLIIKYHLKALNPSYAYALTDVSQLGVFWSLLQGLKTFFNFSSVLSFIIGIIMLIGLIYLFLDINNSKCRYFLYFFFGTLIAASHYLITKPLLNKWMEPNHMLGLIWFVSSIMFIFGIKLLNITFKKSIKKNVFLILTLLVILGLIIPSGIISIKNYDKDRWVQYGKTMDAPTKNILDIGEWIKQNTDKNDVFLSNDETAFALNAVSGAKVVMSRRVHASYFADVDQRYADGVVMLYGTNKSITLTLLKKYNVKYVYFDQYLLQSQMIVNLNFKDYLKENGINFTIAEVPLDPSTLEAPKFKSLVINPQNLTILDFVKPVKEFKINGQTAAAIYKI